MSTVYGLTLWEMLALLGSQLVSRLLAQLLGQDYRTSVLLVLRTELQQYKYDFVWCFVTWLLDPGILVHPDTTTVSLCL